MSNGKKLIICNVYCPGTLIETQIEEFYDVLSNTVLSRNDETKYLILGDFNVPNISWTSSSFGFAQPLASSGYKSDSLLDFLSLVDFQQFNLVENTNGKVLDLVMSNMCNSELLVENATHLKLCNIDAHHPPLLIKLNIKNIKLQNKNISSKINYKKVDNSKVIAELNCIDWDKTMSDMSVDNSLALLYSRIQESVTNNVSKQSSKNKSTSFPHWYPTKLLNLLKLKLKARKKFKLYKTNFYKIEFESYRHAVKK